ncbi:hypothetical protein ALC62_07418 [Cyphomyrmex costatus]|uniref:Uncharacterized protein n=1 Tax=Cyphomyrmex costatus TaxID=456900 RepID=A0A195CM06_9HYME|nr:hypothetical protein ALC62_07418 [Cyphomyrmex costatus]
MSTNVAAKTSRPASQSVSQSRPSLAGTAVSPARIRGVASRPIAASRDATVGQSARAAMTTPVKYSRYISRPVATANYPQSRAGGRRRWFKWLKLDVRPIASAIWIDLRGFYSHGLAIAQGRDATK